MYLKDLPHTPASLRAQVGEILHTGMRKRLDSTWSNLAWNLIDAAALRGSRRHAVWQAYVDALVTSMVKRGTSIGGVPSADHFHRILRSVGITGQDVEAWIQRGEDLPAEGLDDLTRSWLDKQAIMLTTTMQMIPADDAADLEAFLYECLAQ